MKYAAEDADVTLRLWQTVQAATAPRACHHGLRDPRTPARPGAGRDGDGRRPGRPRHAVAACPTPSPRRWRGWRTRSTSSRARRSTSARPKQLGEILFDEMSLPGGEKGKTGAYATGADVLEDLAAEGHDLPAPRPRLAAAVQAEIHLHRRAAGPHQPRNRAASTPPTPSPGPSPGRLASTDPNLQNIPVRTEEGRRIREAFVAPKGKRARQPRLLPDRAAHPRPYRRHPGAEAGVPRRASTSTR